MTAGDLVGALAGLEDGLRELRRTAALEALRPGLAREEVATRLAALALPASDELGTLFGWHDGTEVAELAPTDDVEIFPGFYFPRFDDVAADYRAFLGSDRWDLGWLPVLANGGGDFYVVDLGSGGAVRHFRIDETEHPVEYATLADFIATIDAAIRERVIVVDAEGYLDMDYEAYGDLAARLNPHVDWWRS